MRLRLESRPNPRRSRHCDADPASIADTRISESFLTRSKPTQLSIRRPMLKTVFLTLITLGIAIVGGAWSVRLAIDATHAIGSVTIGQWTAFPRAGTPDADAYSRARFAREGRLSLGQGEGIAFRARIDTSGAELKTTCTYRIAGTMPPARLWTVHATDSAQKVVPAAGRLMPALDSRSLLRSEDGSFDIIVGPHPAPGNWLSTTGEQRMTLVLTLFDTPISNGAGVADIRLPEVVRTRCDG